MTRIATSSFQSVLLGGISRLQGRLADDQRQMASGRKAADYASFGPQTTRNITAHGWQSRVAAQRDVADRVATRLTLNDHHLGSIDEAASTLKKALLDTIGTNNAQGLQTLVEQTFDRFRSSLNAQDADGRLFAGSRRDVDPFTPANLADVAATPAAAAFANDEVRGAAEVEDGVTMRHGLTARDLGGKLYEAFRILADAGPLGIRPDAAQMAAMEKAVGTISDSLDDMRDLRGGNGRKQAEIDAILARHDRRDLLAKQMIGSSEDADLSQVALSLSQHQSLLESSYAVFSKMQGLSLTRFL